MRLGCRTLAAILLAVCGISTSGVSASEEPSVNRLLVGDWRYKVSGVKMHIDADGEYVIATARDSVVMSGTIKSPGWESVDWASGYLVDAVILRFAFEGQEHLASGYYIHGEGDPAGLTLYRGIIHPGKLFDAFGAKEGACELRLVGPGP